MKTGSAKRLFLGTFLATVALAATVGAGDEANHPWIGEEAPAFELESTEGQSVALSDFRDEKLVVIHFAASW